MQTDLNQRMGELVKQLPWIRDVDSAKVAHGGPGGTLLGPVGGPKWLQGFLPCPLVSMCPYLSPYCLFLLKFPAFTCDDVFPHLAFG
jgi:hypothetical protein